MGACPLADFLTILTPSYHLNVFACLHIKLFISLPVNENTYLLYYFLKYLHAYVLAYLIIYILACLHTSLYPPYLFVYIHTSLGTFCTCLFISFFTYKQKSI